MSDTPEILYKYVPDDIALKCIPEIGDRTLRATQPAALNDPFECAVTTGYVIHDTIEEYRELAKILTEINESNLITEQYVRDARKSHGSVFTRQLFAEQVSTKFGIVSFATDPFHPLMWSHYSNDGSGFVIGYDVPELRKLESQKESLRAVQYNDQPPRIRDPIVLTSPISNLLILLSMKSHHWSYENEWRLIVELDKTIGTGQTDQLGQPINLIRVPNEAVVSVHYTERTPPESVDLVRNRLSDANNRYGTKTLTKLVMSSTSYGYEESPD